MARKEQARELDEQALRMVAPSTTDNAVNPAYVASTVSVSTSPALHLFRRAELRSMYVRAEA